MKCFFYLRDLDGHCSGAIVKYKHPECEMIGIDYGKGDKEDFPWDSIQPGETVYMVDFCLQPFEDMLKLSDKCNQLILIDHHKTTILEYEKYNLKLEMAVNFQSYFDERYAACELTWKYLFPNEPMPRAVRLLGRYEAEFLNNMPSSDLDILPFQYGMRAIKDTNPNNIDLWGHFLGIKSGNWSEHHYDSFIKYTIDNGKTILNYIQSSNAKYADSYAFECLLRLHRITEKDSEIGSVTFVYYRDWELYTNWNTHYKCICINRGNADSQLFDSVYDSDKHDLMLAFCRLSSRKWTISLYTTHDHIDCSEIAGYFGGGGHRKAAGFQIKTLPF